MIRSLLVNFSVDKNSKKIKVEREFAAPLARVWAAWTEQQILDQWWAPRPWQTKTKHLDFRVGGYWLYVMEGPAGEAFWSRGDFESIVPEQSFSVREAFCDDQGTVNAGFAVSFWNNTFTPTGKSTRVSIEIKYKTLADLEAILAMGFEEGFLSAMQNLDTIFGQD
jgi:uncharacterized protein YndB with AHSA1/START domain